MVETIVMISICSVVIAVLCIGVFITVSKRLVRGKADALLVVTGLIKGNKKAKILHGGLTFVWPILQSFKWIPLTPYTVNVALENALSLENIRVSLPCTFIIAVDKDNPEMMENAAVRLADLLSSGNAFKLFIEDLMFGQMRAIVSEMKLEEINSNRKAFQQKIIDAIGVELAKVGMYVLNANIKDIKDEAEYISNLGKKAAAEALSKAKSETAEQQKIGDINVAAAESDRRAGIAEQNKRAIEAENISQSDIAKSNSELERNTRIATANANAEAAVKEAEAYKQSAIAKSNAETEILEAQTKAEEARKTRDILSKLADVTPDAEAAKIRQEAEGTAAGLKIKAEMIQRAEGMHAMYTAQAEGIQKIVAATGGDTHTALLFMLNEHIPGILTKFAETIASRRIDNLTIISGNDTNSNSSGLTGLTNQFISALPQLKAVTDTLGLEMPLIKQKEKQQEKENTQYTSSALGLLCDKTVK